VFILFQLISVVWGRTFETWK